MAEPPPRASENAACDFATSAFWGTGGCAAADSPVKLEDSGMVGSAGVKAFTGGGVAWPKTGSPPPLLLVIDARVARASPGAFALLMRGVLPWRKTFFVITEMLLPVQGDFDTASKDNSESNSELASRESESESSEEAFMASAAPSSSGMVLWSFSSSPCRPLRTAFWEIARVCCFCTFARRASPEDFWWRRKDGTLAWEFSSPPAMFFRTFSSSMPRSRPSSDVR